MPKSDAVRKTASIAGAVVVVAGAGIGSALFVDYLAERAVVRAEASPRSEAAPAAARAELAVAKAAPAQPAEPKPTAALPVAPAAPSEIAQPARIAAPPAEPQPAPAAEEAAPQPVLSESAEADEGIADRTFTAAIAPRPIEPAPAEPALADTGDGAGEQAAIAAAEIATESAAAEPTRTAKVTEYVNLRAGPKDEAKVLTVVPASETVQVVSCKGWCEVEYKGQRGFIYKSFIGG